MAKEGEEKEDGRPPVVYLSQDPCHFLKEVMKAVLKCLGLQSFSSSSDESCSTEEADKDTETGSSAAQAGTNSSSTTQKDSSSNTTIEAVENVSRRSPGRPPISSESRPGGGSQIN